jgi:hypothetical protein
LIDSAPIPGRVPPTLRTQFGKPRHSGNASIAGDPAREYRWAKDGRSLVAYVLATPTGDAAIMCDAPVRRSVDSSACARIVEHAAVNGSTVVPGPDRALRTALAPTFVRLSRLPRSLARADGSLPTRERATTAAALAVTRAASVLDGLDVAPRYAVALGQVRGALEQEASSLSALAAAVSAIASG